MAVAFRTAPEDSSGMPRRTPWNEDSMSMTSSRSWKEADGGVGEAGPGLVWAEEGPKEVLQDRGWAGGVELVAKRKFMIGEKENGAGRPELESH